MNKKDLTINAGGMLVDFSIPLVMGIVNVTPDSFYAASRMDADEAISARARQIVDEGGRIIDVGAYSSRPGAADVPVEEEMRRLRRALPLISRAAPEVLISVDTFRADVARMCVEELGAHIINDIAGGSLDRSMFRTIAHLGVPYVLMHMQGTPTDMQVAPHYENVEQEVMLSLARRVQQLRDAGVADVIVDPGFGFGKTLAHNYALMDRLADFEELEAPILVGVSRKSMVYKLLGTTPEGALAGTIALGMAALERGADILRVHDVQAAADTVRIYRQLVESRQA